MRAATGTPWNGFGSFGLGHRPWGNVATGNNGGPTPSKPVRCAIYTRKSTEEGLSQESNWLDAQRKAAETYIRSQAGEGWTALRGYPERRYPARRSFSRAWCKSIFMYVW